jgi:hypothetical protein
MGKLTAQLEETTYSFSRVDEVVRLVADENDKVRTTVSHRAVWQQLVSTGEPSV